MRAAVELQGLRDGQRALVRSGAVATRTLNKELRGVARETAERARALARRKSGKMARSIRPYARRGEIGIRATAENQGYPYPRRQEFDPAMGGSFMRRAIAETVDEDEILDAIGDAIERAFER